MYRSPGSYRIEQVCVICKLRIGRRLASFLRPMEEVLFFDVEREQNSSITFVFHGSEN